jgi:signal transduction histidine kinase
VATALYRVAQESLRNALRHSRAGSAELRLRTDADGVTLEVEDGGIGFDPSAASSKAGLGLTSLSERMKLVRGRVMVRSTPGGGTRITAWAPMPAAVAAGAPA